MQKVVVQHSPSHNPSAARQGRGIAVEPPQGERIAQLEAVIESSPQIDKHAQLAAMADASPAITTQRNQIDVIQNGPRMTVQRKAIEVIHNSSHVIGQGRKAAVPQRKLQEIAINDSQEKQSRAIPEMLGNHTVENRFTPIQRKIKVKGGPTYKNKGELPEGLQGSVDLQGKADAAGIYLAKKTGDLTKRVNNEESEILSPHRHLIGEVHTESKFTEAIENWGWGADKMAESFQTSTDVPDILTTENKALQKSGFFTNPYYQAKELENLHPYIIQGLSMLRFVLSELKTHTSVAKNCAERIALKVNVDSNKKTFNQAEDIISDERSRALEIWESSISPHINSYVSACTVRLRTARGEGSSSAALLHDMATAMAGKWAKIRSNIVVLSKKNYGITDSWAETYEKLQTRENNLNDYITAGIDEWADHLVKLTKAEARVVAGDDSLSNIIEQGWATAKGTDNPRTAVNAIGPMREIFMQNNINTNLNVPGIVQIGSAHVTNLKNKITNGKYHDNYDDFVADTKK